MIKIGHMPSMNFEPTPLTIFGIQLIYTQLKEEQLSMKQIKGKVIELDNLQLK